MAVVFNEESLSTPNEVYWTHQGPGPRGGDRSDAYVPGVTDVGNRRPPKLNGRKPKEVKVRSSGTEVKVAPGSEVKANSTCSKDKTKDLAQAADIKKGAKKTQKREQDARSVNSSRGSSGSVHCPSLKDLCAEDKLRVANLIKELAKVGEEKEEAVETLHTERLGFERQILALLEQQELILRDRQGVQAEMKKYQETLSEYEEKLKRRACPEPVKDKHQEQIDSKVPAPQKLTPSRDGRHSNPSSSSENKDEDSDDQRQRRRKSQRKGDRYKKSGSRISSGDVESSRHDHRPSPKRVTTLDQADLNKTLSETKVKDTQGSGVKVTESGRSEFKASSRSSAEKYREMIPERDFQQEMGTKTGPVENVENFQFQKSAESDNVRTPYCRKRPSEIKRKLLSHGPLPEPIMSSTQKSSDIYADMSFKSKSSSDFYPLPVADSPRTTRGSFIELLPLKRSDNLTSDMDAENNRETKVNFNSENHYSDNAPICSPKMPVEGDFEDPDFAAYYRKLGPNQRKQELISQRSALLEEQNRLRQILIEQENMLHWKRQQLNEQQMLQAQRLAHFEQTGEFPLVHHGHVNSDIQMLRQKAQPKSKPEFLIEDNPPLASLHQQNKFSPNSKQVSQQREDNHVRFNPQTEIRGGNLSHRPTFSQIQPTSNAVHSGSSPRRVNLVSTATSPLRSSPDRRLSNASSPQRPDHTSPRQPAVTPPRHFTDAATSYSVAVETQTDSSPSSPRGRVGKQGNLPLSTNRQRSDYKSPVLNTSADLKGFSVLEILEKLESEPDTSLNSQNSSGGAIYPACAKGNNSAQGEAISVSLSSRGNNSLRDNVTFSTRLSDESDIESQAELEESKVLEDVFFLK